MSLLKVIQRLVVFAPLLSLLSCQHPSGTLNNYPGLKSRIIDFSSADLEALNTDEKVEYVAQNSATIVLIVLKGKCESCHLELNEWQAMIHENKWEDQAQFLVVIEEGISYLLEHEIESQSKFSIPIYHDKEGNFITNNNLKPLLYERAAILNSNRTIRYVGSPLLKPHLKASFLKSAGLD